MPIKILEIITEKCKQLNEPPPKPQQERQKKGKTIPLTDKKRPTDKNKQYFLDNIYIYIYILMS